MGTNESRFTESQGRIKAQANQCRVFRKPYGTKMI